MSRPVVVCVVPIRNRAWAFQPLMELLRLQTLPLSGVIFVTGDNADDTEAAIERSRSRYATLNPEVVFLQTGCPAWSRDGADGPRYSMDDHANLARVYNACLDAGVSWRTDAGYPGLKACRRASHVWLNDSDVIPEPDVLRLLVEALDDSDTRLDITRPAISPLVRSSPGAWNFMLCRGDDGEPVRSANDDLVAAACNPASVAFSSASTLLRWETLRHTASGREPRFAPHPRSHDFPFMATLGGSSVHPLAHTAHYFHGPDRAPLLSRDFAAQEKGQ